MKTVVVLTDTYPQPAEGDFFKKEAMFWGKSTARVITVPCRPVISASVPSVDSGIESVERTKYSNRMLGNTLFLSTMLPKVLTDKLFWRELKTLKAKKLLSPRQFLKCFAFFARGIYLADYIKKKALDVLAEADEIIFYSFWMSYHALTAVRLRNKYRKATALSRCHGYDLYGYRYKENYVIGQSVLVEELDKIYPISENGRKYLIEQYPSIENKVSTQRMGVVDNGVEQMTNRDVLNVVSCSALKSVKRVHHIAEALKNFPIKVVWTHIGDGSELPIVRSIIEQASDNLTTIFTGNVSNEKITEMYAQKSYDVFVNCSESEGLPISIMEALSFGIPVIAPDIGGIPEQITDGVNGILLSKAATPEEIRSAILRIYNSSNEEYNCLRRNARKQWEDKFNSETNYLSFIRKIID